MRGCAPLRGATGVTLVELIISLTVAAVVLGALVGVALSVQRGYVAQREMVRAQESLRGAQIIVATVLRSAGADPLSTGQTLLDPDPESHGRFDNLRVVSDFNPADGDVTDPLEDVLFLVEADTLFVRWDKNGQRQPLAYPIDDLRFEYYANDGSLLTSASQVSGATRVRFILEAPRDARSGRLERIDSWVYLRNRR